MTMCIVLVYTEKLYNALKFNFLKNAYLNGFTVNGCLYNYE